MVVEKVKILWFKFSSVILEFYNSSFIEESIRKASDFILTIILSILIEAIRIYILIARPLYILVIGFGLIYYLFSGSYRNKKFIYGGILLAIFSELILPQLIDYFNIPV